MTKSKSTKRALLSSVLALVLTCAMLIGTTFAWFTDSAKSGKNKIVAGNLDVELEYATVGEDGTLQNWTSVEGSTDLFEKNTLWEPGHAEVVYLKARNAGTLALKYNFAMNIASETTATSVLGNQFKLSQYLKYGVVANQTSAFANRSAAIAAVTDPTALSGYSKEGNLLPNADPVYAAIVVYMPETVGNEANYRGDVIPQIDLGLRLRATQFTYEKDSWDNQYDANAAYPVVDTATLNAITANISTSEPTVVVLSNDVSDISGIKTQTGADLTMDFNGNTATIATPVGSSGTETNGMQLLKGSTVLLKNGTFAPANNSVKMLVQNYSNLTLQDFTFDAHDAAQVGYALSNNNGDVLITGETNILAADGKCAFDAYYWPRNGYTDGVRVVIDENATGLIKGKIEFTDDGTDTTGAADPAKHSIVIKGGYFTEDPSAYVPAGYTVIPSNCAFEINGNAYAANYQVVRN